MNKQELFKLLDNTGLETFNINDLKKIINIEDENIHKNCISKEKIIKDIKEIIEIRKAKFSSEDRDISTLLLFIKCVEFGRYDYE